MKLINTAWAKVNLGGLDTTATGAGYVKKAITDIAGSAVNIVLSAIAILFLLLMIYGGMMWMTAQGNEDQVSRARKLIIAAVIGLIIVVAAFVVTSFLGDALGPQTINNYRI
ncbi:MAG: hypothetical protein V1765_03565 [bacterium]